MIRQRRRKPALTVRAVVEHDGKYLFLEAEDESSRSPGESWFYLPGGHVEHGETLCSALERELREETGLTIEPISPLSIREFIAPRHRRLSPQMPTDHHVIALIFLCRIPAEAPTSARLAENLDGSTIVKGHRWLAPDELPELDLRPPHLRAILSNSPPVDGRFVFWPEE